MPGTIMRLVPGSNPPETALAEVYNVPLPGFGLRGGDIDKNGVVWVSLASGHLGSFDRRKCKGPLNGPKRDGRSLPRGLVVPPVSPGRASKASARTAPSRATTPGSTSTTRSGSARTCRWSTGNLNDGLIALKDGKMVSVARALPDGLLRQGLRRPHRRSERGLEGPRPMGGERRPHAVAHEGGKGSKPMAVHFQMRPDPLAK